MNILDAVVNAGERAALKQLGSQFGLGEEQTAAALSALVPALATDYWTFPRASIAINAGCVRTRRLILRAAPPPSATGAIRRPASARARQPRRWSAWWSSSSRADHRKRAMNRTGEIHDTRRSTVASAHTRRGTDYPGRCSRQDHRRFVSRQRSAVLRSEPLRCHRRRARRTARGRRLRLANAWPWDRPGSRTVPYARPFNSSIDHDRGLSLM